MNNEIMPVLNPDCPCKRSKCPRHGNCVACRERHAGKKEPEACRRPSREEKRLQRKSERTKNE